MVTLWPKLRTLSRGSRDSTFGPDVALDSLFHLGMACPIFVPAKKRCMLLAQTSFFGYYIYIGYYGITGVIPCPGEQIITNRNEGRDKRSVTLSCLSTQLSFYIPTHLSAVFLALSIVCTGVRLEAPRFWQFTRPFVDDFSWTVQLLKDETGGEQIMSAGQRERHGTKNIQYLVESPRWVRWAIVCSNWTILFCLSFLFLARTLNSKRLTTSQRQNLFQYDGLGWLGLGLCLRLGWG